MSGFLFDMGEGTDEEPQEARNYDRDYQTKGYRDIHRTLVEDDQPACQALWATGLGKTNLAIKLIQRTDWPKDGVIFCTPRRELVRQSAERLRSLGVPCGIEMAEDRSDERVTVACYASLIKSKRHERYLNNTGLFIVDESHLNYTKASRLMVESFKDFGTKILGMTATPKVGKRSSLYETYGDVASKMSYFDGVEQGWLVPAKSYLTVLEDIDLSAWRESFVGSPDDLTIDGKPKGSAAVGKFMARKEIVTSICGMVEQYWEGKPSVVFCMTIEQANEVQEELNNRKIPTSVVHSKMENHERYMHLQDFEDGKSGVIVNVGCLTLGWDSPKVEKLFIARPTKSSCLFVQMFGRGTRTVPGLVDRYATARERKDAIARSRKPYMEVFDITDSSRSVDLKTSMDILRPDLDPRLMKRVRDRTGRQSSPTVEVDSILAEEAAALAREDAEDARYEYDRRKNISGSSICNAYERDIRSDPDAPQRGKGVRDYWWMPYGRHKGKGFSKIPIQDLEYYARNAPENIARNIRKYLRNKR